jgi:hypothetical protein
LTNTAGAKDDVSNWEAREWDNFTLILERVCQIELAQVGSKTGRFLSMVLKLGITAMELIS